MKYPITFPLKLQMRSHDVANLHTALCLLLDRGILLHGDEARRRKLSALLQPQSEHEPFGMATFGKVTQKVVLLFQQEHRLRPTGEVNRPTAQALNAMLRDAGLFFPDISASEISADSHYTVLCHLVDARDAPLPGLRIEAYNADPNLPDVPIGEPTTTDATGRAVFRFKQSDFTEHLTERGPDLYFRVYRETTLLRYVLSSVPNDKGVIRGFQPQRAPIVIRVDEHHVIEGRILLDYGLAAENVRIRLYQRGFGGSATPLDETTTQIGGKYVITYDPGAAPISLEIRAVNTSDDEIPLSKPLNQLSVEPHTHLNLVAPRALQPLRAEYRRLSDDLAPHVGKIKTLAAAKENGERQDLTVLNRATGWDARLIAMAAMAERLSRDAEVKLPQEAVYGLLRAGLPSNKVLLANVSPDVAEQALKTVRDAGIVELTDQGIAQFKQQFSVFANTVRLTMPVPGSRSTYAQMLKASGLSADAQKRFASVVLSHRGGASTLWENARKAGLSDAQIRKLQLQGKLGFLAGSSEPMTSWLMNMNFREPVELVEKGLYKAEAWKAEITALVGKDKQKLAALIPTAYPGKKVADRLNAYAEDMARKVRLSYPTQVLGHVLDDDKTDLYKLGATRVHTVKLLKDAAAKGFRLGQKPVTAFFKQNSADPEFRAARQQLMTLHRVYQITPNNEAMPVLMSLGLTSAYDVMAYTEEAFVERYTETYRKVYPGKNAPQREAQLVHRKATQVCSVTYNVFNMVKALDSSVPVFGISAPTEVQDSVKTELLKHFPTMESLFGSMDFCACEHCRSVLSPAAYLVDLLQFIDIEPDVWDGFLGRWAQTHAGKAYSDTYKKPYDALIERRPDLSHIALTCENTHTALPYIDLVNEILEYYVAHEQLDAKAAHDTSDATTAELLAEPQNVIRDAYRKVLEARYPLTLPFDLWLETARAFCDYFEVPLWRVLEAFRPDDGLFVPARAFDRSAIFMEFLGLSPTEVDILTDPDPLATWHTLYGFDATAEAKAYLGSAKALSRRLGVTYQELVDIVKTGFVNPQLDKLVILYKLGVSIHDARFYLGNKGLLEADPTTLTMEQQQQRLEVEAFEGQLQGLADRFNRTPAELNAELQSIPFGQILVLADPDAGCNFDQTAVRYADGREADDIAFLRINLFVRLWRKLGWTIEEIDRALQAFVPKNAPFDTGYLAQQPLKTALIYVAHLKALDERVRVGKHSRLKLVTLWSDMATTGKDPLYAQLFLARSVLKADDVFDDALGQYLSAPGVLLKEHLLALQGALSLPTNEIRCILEDAGLSIDAAELSLANVSLLYRYALLAKALKLPMRDFIAIKQLSGLDPFKSLHPDPLMSLEEDHPFAQTLRFVEVIEQVKDSGLTIEDLDYLLRHRFDDTGKYRPDREGMLALLNTLAEGVRAIRQEHADHEEPLVRQFIVQKLTAHTGADPALVEGLVTDARLLGMPQPEGDPLPLLAVLTATLAQMVLDPLTAIEDADRALVLLSKSLQIAQSFGLNERELRYLLAHAADFSNLDLKDLPTQALDDSATAEARVKALFEQFLRLASYARLKRDVAGGTEDLIELFEANETGDLNKVYSLIARLTRRDDATVRAAAEVLFAAPAFLSGQPLQRLWEALQIVERFGVPVAALVDWTGIVSSAATPDQRFGVARDLKDAIKTRFDPEAWQRVAQPIFDKLRKRQRDALVAYVMHQRQFASMEPLYEHFLIDPGMESVVQTSRIRLAIGSVQLFIQRCLLNLEKDVHPSAILNAKQWEWMKRYRVWEANRKIFLFPENWLEPEFRDDKTHLFTELEGALLQGDVSSDLVEDAFVNYLRKLEELARLCIVAMHLEEKVDPTQNTLHVIGRTYSQPHKYFYRRYARQMWTPWEPVNVDIEGDHLAPVIWRDRLVLFWVTFIDKPDGHAKPTGSAASTKMGNLTLKDVATSMQGMVANKTVEVHLHWSEYLEGEWSTRESGSFSAPLTTTVTNTFDPRSVFIHVAREAYEDGEERGVYIHLGGAISKAFYMAGRNSIPEKAGYTAGHANHYSSNIVYATRYEGSGPLTVTFAQRIETEDGHPTYIQEEPFPILQKSRTNGGKYTLLPCDNDITPSDPDPSALMADNPEAVAAAIKGGLAEISSLMKPIFYQDNAHTFFIEPNMTEWTIEEWQEWVTLTPLPDPDWQLPHDWIPIPEIPRLAGKGPLIDPSWDPHPESMFTLAYRQDWLFTRRTGLLFDGDVIGSSGRAGLAARNRIGR